MIGKDENNQVHELNSTFNGDVVELIAAIKVLEDPRACIDYLSHGKSLAEIKEYKEKERINKRAGEIKSEIGADREVER